MQPKNNNSSLFLSCFLNAGLEKDAEVSLTVKMMFNSDVADADEEDFDNFAVYSHLQGPNNKKTFLQYSMMEKIRTKVVIHDFSIY